MVKDRKPRSETNIEAQGEFECAVITLLTDHQTGRVAPLIVVITLRSGVEWQMPYTRLGGGDTGHSENFWIPNHIYPASDAVMIIFAHFERVYCWKEGNPLQILDQQRENSISKFTLDQSGVVRVYHIEDPTGTAKNSFVADGSNPWEEERSVPWTSALGHKIIRSGNTYYPLISTIRPVCGKWKICTYRDNNRN